MKCANRGCDNEAATRLTKCAPCLLGHKRLGKLNAQVVAVTALPPLVAPAGGWAFRVPGSPRSWNNALARPRHGRPYLQDWAREWKRTVGNIAAAAKPSGWPMDAKYSVEIRSWFQTNASDVDGPVKLVLDALKGIAWRDDRQVFHSPPWKAVDPVAPRLEVTIRVMAAESAA